MPCYLHRWICLAHTFELIYYFCRSKVGPSPFPKRKDTLYLVLDFICIAPRRFLTTTQIRRYIFYLGSLFSFPRSSLYYGRLACLFLMIPFSFSSAEFPQNSHLLSGTLVFFFFVLCFFTHMQCRVYLCSCPYSEIHLNRISRHSRSRPIQKNYPELPRCVLFFMLYYFGVVDTHIIF